MPMHVSHMCRNMSTHMSMHIPLHDSVCRSTQILGMNILAWNMNMCMDMHTRAGMWGGTHGHVCVSVCRTYTVMCPDVCTDMCVGTHSKIFFTPNLSLDPAECHCYPGQHDSATTILALTLSLNKLTRTRLAC